MACLPFFGEYEYVTGQNGPIWILGSAVFYDYVVQYAPWTFGKCGTGTWLPGGREVRQWRDNGDRLCNQQRSASVMLLLFLKRVPKICCKKTAREAQYNVSDSLHFLGVALSKAGKHGCKSFQLYGTDGNLCLQLPSCMNMCMCVGKWLFYVILHSSLFYLAVLSPFKLVSVIILLLNLDSCAWFFFPGDTRIWTWQQVCIHLPLAAQQQHPYPKQILVIYMQTFRFSVCKAPFKKIQPLLVEFLHLLVGSLPIFEQNQLICVDQFFLPSFSSASWLHWRFSMIFP